MRQGVHAALSLLNYSTCSIVFLFSFVVRKAGDLDRDLSRVSAYLTLTVPGLHFDGPQIPRPELAILCHCYVIPCKATFTYFPHHLHPETPHHVPRSRC